MESRRPAIRRIAIYAAVTAVVFAVVAATGNIPSSDEARDFGNDLGPCRAVPLRPALRPRQLPDRLADPRRRGGPPVRHRRRHAARARGRDPRRARADGHRAQARGRAPRPLPPQAHEARREASSPTTAPSPSWSRASCRCLPYGVVNYSGGLIHLPYKAMALGTVIGARSRRCSPTPPSAAASTTSPRRRRSPPWRSGVLGLAGALCSSPGAATHSRDPVAACSTRSAPENHHARRRR